MPPLSFSRRTFLQVSAAAFAIPVGSIGHVASPPRLRRADSFLGVHFDFHADDDSVNVGGRTTRAMIESVIDQVRPDYIQVDCKGHRGLSSYPTKVGHAAPSFVGDQLRLWREVTAERGVALYLHYSGIWDAEAVRRHPDWAVVHADGTRDDHITSQFGAYADELLIPQLTELIDVYGIDGVWIDGECWAAKHDYRPAVGERFRATTGITDVPKQPGDPHWFEWTEFNRQGFRDYVRHYADRLHAHAPAFQLTSNWAFSDHMPEPVTLPLDFLSGDFTPTDSVNSARFAGRCLAGQGKPWDLMAWSFGGRYDEGAWSQKSVPQLQREAATVLALGGGFQAYFTQARDAAIRTWQLPLMHDVAAFARARQPFCHKARAVPQIGLIYAGSAYYRMNPRLFPPYGGELTAIHGILSNLLDAQQAVEICMEHHLRGRMSDYPLLVYPEWPTADETFRQELLAYVRRGGTLLVIGPQAGRLFDDVSSVSGAETTMEETRWLEYAGQLAALKTQTARVSPGTGVERFGALHASDDFTPSPSPAATITPLGQGRLAIAWLNLGERYVNARTLVAKDFLAALVRTLFPAPIVTASGSHAVDVTVMRLDGRLHVHLVNTSGPHEDKNVYVFDEVAEVGPLAIELHLPAAPRRIVAQPAGADVPFAVRDGIVRLTVPRVAIHDVLVVE